MHRIASTTRYGVCAAVVAGALSMSACGGSGDDGRVSAGTTTTTTATATATTTTTTSPTVTTSSRRSFCARFTALMAIVDQVPPDARPNLAAATQLVALQQQLVDAAPDGNAKDAAAHVADVALANADGRSPTPEEQAASSQGVAQLTRTCAAGP
jgi:hypothetical protein